MYEYEAKDGKIYYIDLDFGQNVSVQNSSGGVVGTVTFLEVNADDDELPTYFYLQDLNLQKCKGLGIGREIFRLHKEHIGDPIVAASEFGPSMEDGSHLIDDGIPFVRKMRSEGLICPETSDEDHLDSDDY